VNDIKSGVREVVEQLVQQNGGVRPSELLAAARPKTSPAHAGFEWDNRKAGERYRLIQARQWLRIVRVRYEETEERLVHVPSRADADEEDNEGIYRTTNAVVRIPDEFERALAQATATLHAARRAVEELRSAVDRNAVPERSAMISQISHGLQILETALGMVH
jgi:hypothetical protein